MKRLDQNLVLVVAGNYSQAQCWAREKGLRPAHDLDEILNILEPKSKEAE